MQTNIHAVQAFGECESVDSCDFLDAVQDPNHNADKNWERSTLARKENTAVNCVKIIVFLVLLVTAVLVSAFFYLYTSNDQKLNF
jgi:hypothetical protein